MNFGDFINEPVHVYEDKVIIHMHTTELIIQHCITITVLNHYITVYLVSQIYSLVTLFLNGLGGGGLLGVSTAEERRFGELAVCT